MNHSVSYSCGASLDHTLFRDTASSYFSSSLSDLEVGVERGLQEAVAPHVAAQQQQGGRSRRHHGLPVEVLPRRRAQLDVLPPNNLPPFAKHGVGGGNPGGGQEGTRSMGVVPFKCGGRSERRILFSYGVGHVGRVDVLFSATILGIFCRWASDAFFFRRDTPVTGEAGTFHALLCLER